MNRSTIVVVVVTFVLGVLAGLALAEWLVSAATAIGIALVLVAVALVGAEGDMAYDRYIGQVSELRPPPSSSGRAWARSRTSSIPVLAKMIAVAHDLARSG